MTKLSASRHSGFEVSHSSQDSMLTCTLGASPIPDRRCVQISHGSLNNAMKITFMRTLRVPDNQDISALPPSLGQFPLFSVADYQKTMPADMVQKGGIFLPMYQREAMWLQFQAARPFAVKLFVGGVNAISGIPMDESPADTMKRLHITEKIKQDYLVLPDQPWIDGIATSDGEIRQFVAMPKGTGYSVEAQVTGEEKIDGLQFEIIPVKLSCPNTVVASMMSFNALVFPSQTTSVSKTLKLRESGLHDGSTVLDLQNLIMKEFKCEPQHQGRLLQNLQSLTSDFSVSQSTIFADMYLKDGVTLSFTDLKSDIPRPQDNIFARGAGHPRPFAAPGAALPPPPTFAAPLAFGSSGPASISGNSNGSSLIGVSSGGPNLFGQMSEGASGTNSVHAFGASSLSKIRTEQTGMSSTSVVDGRIARNRRQMTQDDITGSADEGKSTSVPPIAAPQVKSMGLAAGGRIKQSINADTYSKDVWDTTSTIFLNVQLLNSESFQAVTGRAPPETPVTAATYHQHGWPFFDIWAEEKSGVAGDFGKLKSVVQIDEQKSLQTKDGSSFWAQLKGEQQAVASEHEKVKEVEFKGDEKLKFPVVTLDMSKRATFMPLSEMIALSKIYQ